MTVMVNRGLKPGLDPCRHCGGLHFGSGFACPYLCGVCYKDIRNESINNCKCLIPVTKDDLDAGITRDPKNGWAIRND